MNKLPYLILCFVLMQSCITYERCVDRFGQASQDTTYIPYEKYVPVYVTVPADSIEGIADLDSLINGQINEIRDENSSLILQYWMDEYNRLLHMKAMNPEKVVRDTVYVSDTVPCPPCPPVLVKPSPSKLERIYNKYKEVAGWVLPTIILTFLIIRRWIK